MKYTYCPYLLGGYVIRPTDWGGIWDIVYNDTLEITNLILNKGNYIIRVETEEQAKELANLMNTYDVD